MKLRLFNVALLTLGMLPGLSAAQLSGLPMANFTAGGTGLTPFYVLGFELGPWQDYLARELTPEFMDDASIEPLHISWMDYESVVILPVFAEQLMGKRSNSSLRIDLEWQYSGETSAPGLSRDQKQPGLGFERTLLSPGIMHQFNDNQLLGVSAIFAHQSYGVANLGMRSYDSEIPSYLQTPTYSPYEESGYGTGVRLTVRSEITEGMAFDAGFQSRIDMEEFASYRGVYSEPADLDIPARASVGLAFQASSHSWLNVSVERVMYSEVNAFPSRMLPDRFLSLLGDSTSPEFSWDDLTVYSVGWSWSNGDDTQWHLDFSSRSQPTPSSHTLSQALAGDLADNAMVLGYSKRLGQSSRFDMNAAYAPSEFAFGGNVLGVTSDNLDQNFEIEAFWTWDF
jgi:long-chain fatty acid transport protein